MLLLCLFNVPMTNLCAPTSILYNDMLMYGISFHYLLSLDWKNNVSKSLDILGYPAKFEYRNIWLRL